MILVTQKKLDLKRFVRYLVWTIIILAILWWSAVGTNLNFGMLRGGLQGVADIVGRMVPPDFSILERLVKPTIETIQISIWGTILAILLSIPFGVLAARNLSPHPVVCQISRIILNAIRAIPDMLFALIFVAAIGLGPLPGVLGIGVSSSGMLGKFLADFIENIDKGPLDALKATGAKKMQIISYAVVPQIIPEFVTLALFRWEMNFRASTVIGMVGAGGLGFELMTSMRLFQYKETATILIVILIVVTIVDFISTTIRKRII